MVMYRDFARRSARALGLTGSARNLPNGAVEVVAQGEEEALRRFIARLERGPLLSRVERVEADWRVPSERYDDFRITY
jgi:acylphosphatase